MKLFKITLPLILLLTGNDLFAQQLTLTDTVPLIRQPGFSRNDSALFFPSKSLSLTTTDNSKGLRPLFTSWRIGKRIIRREGYIRLGHRKNYFSQPDIMLDSFMQVLQNREVDSANIQPIESRQVRRGDIRRAFSDGKIASGYGFIIQVQQPEPGTRKHITGFNNVGHTFITLVKYNVDGSFLVKSFGFYPDKESILSATPISPETLSAVKEDSKHHWTEAVGKPINKNQFDTIVQLVTQYEDKDYHLSKNNCTDFGLCAASVAGIQISDTRGSWFGGSGNNPGDAGESILEGKVTNKDTGSAKGLLIKVMPAKSWIWRKLHKKQNQKIN